MLSPAGVAKSISGFNHAWQGISMHELQGTIQIDYRCPLLPWGRPDFWTLPCSARSSMRDKVSHGQLFMKGSHVIVSDDSKYCNVNVLEYDGLPK